MRQIVIVSLACAVGFAVGVASHAGFSEDNISAGVHRNPGDTGGPAYVLRLHRGSQGVDTSSPEISTGELLQLRAAALDSQAEFDTVAGSILGSWYSQAAMTSARKAEFRTALADLCS